MVKGIPSPGIKLQLSSTIKSLALPVLALKSLAKIIKLCCGYLKINLGQNMESREEECREHIIYILL